jgi:hypothetical protein
MPGGLEPTESTEKGITVVLLGEEGKRERIHCNSFTEAISVVREELAPKTVAKIENRNQEIVFTSEEMDIDDWENEWKHAKRRLSVDVEEYDCPYDTVGCFADDHCAQCKMDRVQDQY